MVFCWYFCRTGVDPGCLPGALFHATSGTTNNCQLLSLFQSASAILIYGSIDRPLAQPRSLIGGHFIGALIGVSIAKLSQFIPPNVCHDLQWLIASFAVSLTLVVMQFTHTLHPPAGATALLAVVNPALLELSWYLLPVVLLSSTLALVVALLVNNIQRRYPVFWFTADAPPPPPQDEETGKVDPFRCEDDQKSQETTC